MIRFYWFSFLNLMHLQKVWILPLPGDSALRRENIIYDLFSIFVHFFNILHINWIVASFSKYPKNCQNDVFRATVLRWIKCLKWTIWSQWMSIESQISSKNNVCIGHVQDVLKFFSVILIFNFLIHPRPGFLSDFSY